MTRPGPSSTTVATEDHPIIDTLAEPLYSLRSTLGPATAPSDDVVAELAAASDTVRGTEGPQTRGLQALESGWSGGTADAAVPTIRATRDAIVSGADRGSRYGALLADAQSTSVRAARSVDGIIDDFRRDARDILAAATSRPQAENAIIARAADAIRDALDTVQTARGEMDQHRSRLREIGPSAITTPAGFSNTGYGDEAAGYGIGGTSHGVGGAYSAGTVDGTDEGLGTYGTGTGVGAVGDDTMPGSGGQPLPPEMAAQVQLQQQLINAGVQLGTAVINGGVDLGTTAINAGVDLGTTMIDRTAEVATKAIDTLGSAADTAIDTAISNGYTGDSTPGTTDPAATSTAGTGLAVPPIIDTTPHPPAAAAPQLGQSPPQQAPLFSSGPPSPRPDDPDTADTEPVPAPAQTPLPAATTPAPVIEPAPAPAPVVEPAPVQVPAPADAPTPAPGGAFVPPAPAAADDEHTNRSGQLGVTVPAVTADAVVISPVLGADMH